MWWINAGWVLDEVLTDRLPNHSIHGEANSVIRLSIYKPSRFKFDPFFEVGAHGQITETNPNGD
jgi:hypothetical protein